MDRGSRPGPVFASDNEGPEPSIALTTLAICFAVVFVDGYDLQSIGFLAPEIARSWAVPISEFGIVFGAGLTGTIPGAMLAGPAASRWGRIRVLSIAITIMAIGTGAGALMKNVPALALCRLIGGVGMGGAFPLAMAIVADAAPSHRRAFSTMLLLTGQALGLMFGAAACSRLLPIFGWQAGFGLGGALSLCLLPFVLTLKTKETGPVRGGPESGRATSTAVSEIVRPPYRRLTLGIWIAAILATLETLLIVNWLPALLQEMGYSLSETLLASSITSGAGVTGSVILGILIDRYGPFRVVPLAYAFGTAALLCLVSFHAEHRTSLMICAAIGLGVLGAGTSIGSLTVLYFPSHLRATSAGLALGLGRLSAAIASIFVGQALAAGIDQATILVAAAAVAAAASVNVLAMRRSTAMTRASVANTAFQRP